MVARSGEPGFAVAEITHICGFLRLGQFGEDYRTRFNERPSETPNRAR
jgi:transcriptional regulator GlxA family with amidase domain